MADSLIRPVGKRKSFVATTTIAAIAAIGLLAGANASAGPASASVAHPSVKASAACSNGEAIYNRHSGKVLEVYGSSTANGAKVDQWAYNGTQTQHWCLHLVTHYQNVIPVYEIINDHSGKCLDMPNDNLADGQHLQQYTCNGKEQQHWLWSNEDKYDIVSPFTTKNSNIGFLYMMEVYGSSTANGGEVDVWTGNATAAQEWCPGKACS